MPAYNPYGMYGSAAGFAAGSPNAAQTFGPATLNLLGIDPNSAQGQRLSTTSSNAGGGQWTGANGGVNWYAGQTPMTNVGTGVNTGFNPNGDFSGFGPQGGGRDPNGINKPMYAGPAGPANINGMTAEMQRLMGQGVLAGGNAGAGSAWNGAPNQFQGGFNQGSIDAAMSGMGGVPGGGTLGAGSPGGPLGPMSGTGGLSGLATAFSGMTSGRMQPWMDRADGSMTGGMAPPSNAGAGTVWNGAPNANPLGIGSGSGIDPSSGMPSANRMQIDPGTNPNYVAGGNFQGWGGSGGQQWQTLPQSTANILPNDPNDRFNPSLYGSGNTGGTGYYGLRGLAMGNRPNFRSPFRTTGSTTFNGWSGNRGTPSDPIPL